MLWRYLPVGWWGRWGPLVTTVFISLVLLLLGNIQQLAVVRALRATILYPAAVVDGTLKEFWSLRDRNAELQLELAEASLRLQVLEEARLENARLRDLFAFRDTCAHELYAGRVVGRALDGSGDWSYLTVRLSLPDLPASRPLIAVTPDGLVGRVVERELGFAVVRSLASAKSAVHVVDRRSRVAGVVRAGDAVGSVLHMDHVPAQEDVAPGDTLITSGQGEFYPPGIPVARVVAVDIFEGELIKEVWCEPFVRFSRLEELFVQVGRSEPEVGR